MKNFLSTWALCVVCGLIIAIVLQSSTVSRTGNDVPFDLVNAELTQVSFVAAPIFSGPLCSDCHSPADLVAYIDSLYPDGFEEDDEPFDFFDSYPRDPLNLFDPFEDWDRD